MIGTGHFHFAVDIDDAIFAGKTARRDTHRRTKTGIAEVDVGQTVDLAKFAPLHADHQIAINDGTQQLHFRVAMALVTCLQDSQHILFFHQYVFAAIGLCPASGFSSGCKDQVLQIRQTATDAGLVFHPTVHGFEHSGYSISPEVRQGEVLAALGNIA